MEKRKKKKMISLFWKEASQSTNVLDRSYRSVYKLLNTLAATKKTRKELNKESNRC